MNKRLTHFLKRHPSILALFIAAYGERFRRRYGCKIRLSQDGKSFAVRKGRQELRVALPRSAYLQDACHMFDHYLAAITPEKIDGWEVADFSGPRHHAVPDMAKPFFYSSFPELPRTARDYVRAFDIRAGEIIVDAGAYCGLTASYFSAATGKDGRVIAVEADPQNYAALVSNVQDNRLENVAPVHAALWRESGLLDFASEGSMGSALAAVHPTKPDRVKVPAITLMRLGDELNLPAIHHVKVDIEGAEREVLLASAAFIDRFQPDFLVEMHPDATGKLPTDEIATFFAGRGYDSRMVPQAGGEVYPLVHFRRQCRV
jgi:FkbM family methyltransferase